MLRLESNIKKLFIEKKFIKGHTDYRFLYRVAN